MQNYNIKYSKNNFISLIICFDYKYASDSTLTHLCNFNLTCKNPYPTLRDHKVYKSVTIYFPSL